MSEQTTDTAFEPVRTALRNRPPEPIGENHPAFIGPKTTGQYEEESLCADCMGGFIAHVYVMNLKEAFRQNYCPACVKRFEEESAAKLEATRPKSRLERWNDYCPATYLKTDLDRLRVEGKLATKAPQKMGAAEFVNTILERPLTERGLGLAGDIRLGKTRLMFALLKVYFMAGKKVTYVYAPDFSDTYAGLMSDSAARGNEYLERQIKADLWFLDDLGKGRLSEPAQRALLRVVEKRTAEERPIFVTCNNVGHQLIERMKYEDGTASEYARPMVERLREFCDWWTF